MIQGSQNSKIAIITGGNRGIGRDTILQLAPRGVTSLFTYNTHPDEADKVIADVTRTPFHNIFRPALSQLRVTIHDQIAA